MYNGIQVNFKHRFMYTFLKKCTNSLSNSVGKMATCRSANAGNGEAWALLLAPFPLLPEAAFPLGGTVDMICATLSCSIVHMSCTVNVTGTPDSFLRLPNHVSRTMAQSLLFVATISGVTSTSPFSTQPSGPISFWAVYAVGR